MQDIPERLFLTVDMNLFSKAAVAAAALLAACFSGRSQSYSTDMPAYVILDKSGHKVDYSKMLKTLSRADVCLFGEMHDDPISHWLELTLEKDFHSIKKDRLVVGAEMWESDNRQVLDEYAKLGLINGTTYEENSRLWTNYRDYRPIFEYAVENGIPFVATNVPRRYARMVSDFGTEVLDSLDAAAYQWLAPMPLKVDYGETVYTLIGESFKQMGSAPMMKKNVQNIVAAQALKDATMAHFIVANMQPGDFFFHFHGELHSAFHSGIMYYLKQYSPSLKVCTVSVISEDDPARYKPSRSRADFTIVVPSSMTKTYEQ